MSGRQPAPRPLMELSTSSPVMCLTFKYNKTLNEVQLFSGHQDGKVIQWNWRTRRPDMTTAAHNQSVIWLTVVSEVLASQGRDGVVKFWSIVNKAWRVIGEVPCAAMIFCNSSLCSFNDQHMLIVPSETTAQVTVHNLQQLSPESSEIAHLTSSSHLTPKHPNNYGMCMRTKCTTGNKIVYLFVAYESGILAMWDPLKGSLLTEIRSHNESIMCMDSWYCRDKEIIKCVTGSVDEHLKLWEVQNNQLTQKKTVQILNPGVSDISVREDGKIIAVGGWDGNCRVFSFKNLKPLAVLTFHRSNVQCVSFATNNILATGSKDGYIGLWDIYNT